MGCKTLTRSIPSFSEESGGGLEGTVGVRALSSFHCSDDVITGSSCCSSVPRRICLVRAAGSTAPLIHVLMLALYVCHLLVYIVCFLFPSLFPYLSFPLRIDPLRFQAKGDFIWIVFCVTFDWRKTPYFTIFNFNILRWNHLALQRQRWTQMHNHKSSIQLYQGCLWGPMA